MSKKIVTLITGLIFANSLLAQQFFQFSQYLQNPYVINSAAAGVNDNLDISMSYRKQWSGIQDSPQTFYVSANATLQKQKKSYKPASVRISNPGQYSKVNEKGKLRHAIGAMAASDEYGLFRRTMGAISYAVHVPLNERLTIAAGPSVGIGNLQFDSDRATLQDPNDQTYLNYVGGSGASNVLDLNIAGYLYHDNYFIGYSSAQLLQNNVSFGANAGNAELEAYHNILAGYNFKINRNFRIIPSTLVKYTRISPTAFDLNVKLDYQDRFWFGTSYRYQDALVMMTGFVLNDLIKFGYSFDITTTELSNYSSGSHEIVLGVKLLR